jgi:hypothetical protein
MLGKNTVFVWTMNRSIQPRAVTTTFDGNGVYQLAWQHSKEHLSFQLGVFNCLPKI